MLISKNSLKKGSEVSIKTRSTPASLSFKDQATKHTTVKWSLLNRETLNNYDLNQVADQLFSLKQWQALMKGINLIARIAHSRLMSAKLLDSEHVRGYYRS